MDAKLEFEVEVDGSVDIMAGEKGRLAGGE